jgi:hypothetical protein
MESKIKTFKKSDNSEVTDLFLIFEINFFEIYSKERD